MTTTQTATRFQVTSSGAFTQMAATTFEGARAEAERIARTSNLPSEITDQHGCRWVVYGNGTFDEHCPAVDAGRSSFCECGA
jgi:hypothetical protein